MASSSSFSDLQEDSLPLFQEEDVLTCFEERSYIKDLDTSYTHRLLKFLDPSPLDNEAAYQNKKKSINQQNSLGKQIFSQQQSSSQMTFQRANHQVDKFERPPLSQRVEGTTAGSIISRQQQQPLHQTQPMNPLHSKSVQEKYLEGTSHQFKHDSIDKENNHPNICNAKRPEGLGMRDIPDFQKDKKKGSYDTQLRENLKKSIALLKESSKHHDISQEDSVIHQDDRDEDKTSNKENINNLGSKDIEKILDGIRQISLNISQVNDTVHNFRKHLQQQEELKDHRVYGSENNIEYYSLFSARQQLEKQFMEFIGNYNVFLKEAQELQEQQQLAKPLKELEEHNKSQNNTTNNNNQSNNILSTQNTNASSSSITNSMTSSHHINNKQNMRLIKNITNYNISNKNNQQQSFKQADISQQFDCSVMNQSDLKKQSFLLKTNTLLDNSSQRTNSSSRSNYISTQQQQAPLSARESSSNGTLLNNKTNYNSSQALKTTATPLSARDKSMKQQQLQQQQQQQQQQQSQSYTQRSISSSSESSRSQQQQTQQQQFKERSVSSDLGVILNHSLMGTIFSANKTGRSSSNDKSNEKQSVHINGQIISRITSQHNNTQQKSVIQTSKPKCDSFSIMQQTNQQFKSSQLNQHYYSTSSSYSRENQVKINNHTQSTGQSSSQSMLLPCQNNSNNNTSCDQSQASMGSELKGHTKHPTSSSNRSLSQSQSSQNIVDNLLSQLSGQRAPEKLCRFMQAHPPSSSSLSDGQNCLKTKSSRESIRPVNLDSYLLDEQQLQVNSSQIQVKIASGLNNNSIFNEKNTISRNSSKGTKQQQDDFQLEHNDKNLRESNCSNNSRPKSSMNQHNNKPSTFQEKYTLIKQQLALKII